jgi:predicted transcriptional regulator
MGSEKLSAILQTTELNSTDKVVYLMLVSSANDGKAKIKIRELALSTGMSDITVYQSLKRLKAHNLITSERVPNEKGKPNVYTLIEGGRE